MDSAGQVVAPVHFKWHGLTDRGKVRKNNEDSFLALQFDASEVRYLGKIGEASNASGDFAFAVSDGMGGAMAGEFASKITVEKITKLLPRSFRHSAEGMKTDFADVLLELFSQIHKSLTFVGGSYEECHNMQATLSLCWFTPEWMYFGHVGDTRIYYLSGRDGTLKQVTHDDTYVGWMFRQGQLNEREARTHPRRNVLQKALGAGNQFVEPQVGAVGYEKGDMFLLCSDGLIEGLFDQQLLDLLRSPNEQEAKLNPAERLFRASLAMGGRDNITALVIEVA